MTETRAGRRWKPIAAHPAHLSSLQLAADVGAQARSTHASRTNMASSNENFEDNGAAGDNVDNDNDLQEVAEEIATADDEEDAMIELARQLRTDDGPRCHKEACRQASFSTPETARRARYSRGQQRSLCLASCQRYG